MIVSSSRPTANKALKLATLAVLVIGLAGASSATAKAAGPEPIVKLPKLAAPAVNAELAVCPGQTFSQPFTELGDANYYTPVEGSESENTGQGWELFNGAHVVEGTRADGTSGGVLDMPSGAVAISPPVCVTLLYPTARAWVETVEGAGGLQVGVYYASAKKPAPKAVGKLTAKTGAGWELSASFSVQPQLGGAEEGTREVRFLYQATGKNSDTHVGGLFVDPRLSH
jgi:hypothetical protein